MDAEIMGEVSRGTLLDVAGTPAPIDRDYVARLEHAARELLSWFLVVDGAISASELLKSGCPHHFAADIAALGRLVPGSDWHTGV